MKPSRMPLLLLAGASAFGIGCSSVPLTGRTQLNLIPSSEILALSNQEYAAFLKSSTLSTNTQQVELVRNVGARIRKGVEEYMAAGGYADRLKGYQWEFNLVESKEVNAWCMPGGRVVVYSGILPVTKDETGLAVVMGHEIAHAIAEHGNERMSQQMLAEFGGVALDAALATNSQATRDMWKSAYGIGAQYGALLPFSRSQESEADRLGLVFMAIAGYDPSAAVDFWQRMAASAGGGKPPEFMSTHPSDETRINDIRAALPEAQKHAKPAHR